MYDHLVLPLDGSDESEVAAEHAIDLADRYDATLHLLHVVDTRPYDAEGITQSVIESLEERGREAIDAVAERAADRDLHVTPVVVEGDPHESILEYVADSGVDLIVMATHGRTGFERMLLGSVAERTVRTAPVPVHIVPVSGDDADRSYGREEN